MTKQISIGGVLKKTVKTEGHIPVMLHEIIEHLSPVLSQEGSSFFDGTFGRGGHTRALMEKFPGINVKAFDRDPQAVEYAQLHFANEINGGRFAIEHKNFQDFEPSKTELFDAMLVDLGVSSPQLDQAHRGFSFYHEGPLDMRMDPSQGATAADLVNTLSEEELNSLFQNLGEIQKPYRVTRAIVNDRKDKAFQTTRELASLIERVEGWRKKGFHPGTQYFMALRLRVNGELEAVTDGIEKLILGLKPRGRMAVLTFHSLEDRLVKNIFKSSSLGSPVFKKVIIPGREEEVANPRARSAKLRVFARS